jgi:hypothetical protein
MPTPHCWEDGPKICKAHGVQCDDSECEQVGTTCMELSGHDGEHIFVPDDEITITFKEKSA